MGTDKSKRIVKLKKGEELFREGDSPDAMYIIHKGRLAITKQKGKSHITLAELKPGDLLGEMAFFDKSPRSASVVAITNETEVIELPFIALDQQYAALPQWVKSIMKAVNGHLRRANIKIRQLERTKEDEKEVFSPFTITQLMAILGFVASYYGEKSEEGLQVPGGTLRNYTIQVFQQATHKMQTLTEVLSDFGYMKVQQLGEGKQKILVTDLDFIFNFVDFYNNQLFSESAKKYDVSETQLAALKIAKYYGEKLEKNAKGFVKINLTEVGATCSKDIGLRLSLADVKTLSDVGLLGDYSSDGTNDFIEFEVDYIAEIVPYWDLVHTLKAIQSD
ncbi:MAG: cyclic nucleotide-binding domain-containing protein [Bdellovibrionales bacterium]|nr:cyclic nucleotide-binding domain-containing protein [Bdellovibrionales bacterium]